jgi:hypothetical protein
VKITMPFAALHCAALLKHPFAVGRTAEDYAVVYFGASIFKVTRLLVVAVSSVHFFACLFFKVHTTWAKPDLPHKCHLQGISKRFGG